jgi:hypothetical protein
MEYKPMTLPGLDVVLGPASSSLLSVTSRLAPYIKALHDGELKIFTKMIKKDTSFKSALRVDNLNFLSLIVQEIEKYNTPSVLLPVLKVFSDDKDSDDVSGALGDLVSYYAFPSKSLKFLVESLGDIHPVEILETQMVKTNGLSVRYIADRLTNAYGRNVLGKAEVNYLLGVAKRDNPDGAETTWLQSFYTRQTSVSKKPVWVSVNDTETLDLLDIEPWKKAESSSKKFTCDGIDPIRCVLDQFTLKTKEGIPVNEAMIEEVVSTARSMVKKFDDNIYPGTPFRVFGPLNGFLDRECLTSIVSGGCRMLTCNCRDFDQEKDFDAVDVPEDPYEWFRGNCDNCDHKIMSLSYVVRYPVIGGGWTGTYCSVECLRKLQPRDSTPLGEMLLDSAFGEMSEIGILDRRELTHGKVKVFNEHEQKDNDDISSVQSAYSTGLPTGLAHKTLPGSAPY